LTRSSNIYLLKTKRATHNSKESEKIVKRTVAVIISIVFIFTACDRHAVESEVFNTTGAETETLEAEKTETETLEYAREAASVIAAIGIIAAVIYKCQCNKIELEIEKTNKTHIIYNAIEAKIDRSVPVQEIIDTLNSNQEIRDSGEAIIGSFDVILIKTGETLLRNFSLKVTKKLMEKFVSRYEEKEKVECFLFRIKSEDDTEYPVPEFVKIRIKDKKVFYTSCRLAKIPKKVQYSGVEPIAEIIKVNRAWQDIGKISTSEPITELTELRAESSSDFIRRLIKICCVET